MFLFYFLEPSQKRFANSPAKVNDAGNGESLREEMTEDIKNIKDLVQKKRFGNKRNLVLKPLDDLSGKVKHCGGG